MMLSHSQTTPLRNPRLGSEPQHHRPHGSLPHSHGGGVGGEIPSQNRDIAGHFGYEELKLSR